MDKAFFIGKLCPYCRCAFTESDEIVVCSQCEMPHHRDCWVDNQRCTTFGCQGTIKGIDGIEPMTPPPVLPFVQTPNFCGSCGTRLSPGMRFCPGCGNRI